MNLPFTVPSITSSRKYYFSLEIGEGVLQTSLWTFENHKVQVLSTGSYEKYNHSSDFINAADKSLTQSALSQKIDPTTVKRVILGLPASWLAQERILPEKAKFLKDVCQKLSLKPAGFVVTAESVVRYLHNTEGVPPTAILIGISGHDLEITIVRLGKIVGIHTVKRGEKIVDDVKEGLTRFLPTDLFPSRILLYDHGVELETIRQSLLSFSWQSSQYHLPFLHFPKIDILPVGTSIKAVSTTAGAEAANKYLSEPEPLTQKNIQEERQVSLSFVEDVDLALQPSPDTKKIPNKFPTDKPKSKISLPKFSLPKLPRLHFYPMLIPVIGLILLIILPLFLWYRFTTAKILLSLIPQTISVRFTAQASTKSPTALLLKPITTDAETEINLPTTGTVLVGDKATGEVTIVNGTNQIKTLPAATLLTSSSGLKFETTSNVTIASASGTADPNSYQPGKSNVSVIAQAIGQDSNLSAGTEFKVGSFSSLDFIAKNSTAFSGGSSRQAQAIGKKDLTDAKSQATTDLKSKSEAALKNSLPADSVLVVESISTQVISEDTNFKEGDAADQLILNRKIKISALYYVQSDLDQLVESKLSPQYPNNPKLLSSPKIELVFKSAEPNSYQVNILATVDLGVDIDAEQIISQFLGKPVNNAQNYFSSLTGYSGIEIKFNPSFAKIVKIFPLRRENLSIFTTFVSP